MALWCSVQQKKFMTGFLVTKDSIIRISLQIQNHFDNLIADLVVTADHHITFAREYLWAGYFSKITTKPSLME